MLAGQGPIDKPLVKSAVLALWGTRAYPNLAPDQSRKQLEAHLDAMLEEALPLIQLDGALLARARQLVANIPVSARAYNAIRSSAAAKALPDWRIVDHAGPAADRVFIRMSGKALSEGIPGFYTYDGFHNVLLPQVSDAVKAAAEASWVLGPDRTVQLTEAAARGLMEQAVDLYVRDFTSTWDQLLADVTIVPFRSTPEAADAVNTLSGPSSPLKVYMLAVAQETTMNRPASAAASAATAAAGRAAAATSPTAAAIARLAQAGAVTLEARGQAIDAHFRSLHEFVGGAPNTPSQLDDLIKRLSDLYVQLSSPNPGPPAPGGPAAQLGQQASRLPPPLGAIVAKVAGGTSVVATGATRKTIEDLYTSSVLGLCRQALDGRYPIVKSSMIDIALGDFQNLFKPGGTLDMFFATYLKPYVDTTTSPWTNQKVNNADLGLSRATLAQFERAQTIRNNFFSGGGPAPMVEFTLTPTNLGNDAQQVVFDSDGQVLTYARGPATPVRVQWPAPNAAGRAHLGFTRTNGQMAAIDTTGSWALFRLLDRARMSGNVADQFNVGFDLGGLTANFQLRASSVRNPFRSRELEQFQCPNPL
jgi:type VI secretion system protein ImpL